MATVSEYERKRLEQIKKNNEQLALLGLANAASKLASPKPRPALHANRAHRLELIKNQHVDAQDCKILTG